MSEPAILLVACPYCEKNGRLSRKIEGKKLKCSGCAKSFQVPFLAKDGPHKQHKSGSRSVFVIASGATLVIGLAAITWFWMTARSDAAKLQTKLTTTETTMGEAVSLAEDLRTKLASEKGTATGYKAKLEATLAKNNELEALIASEEKASKEIGKRLAESEIFHKKAALRLAELEEELKAEKSKTTKAEAKKTDEIVKKDDDPKPKATTGTATGHYLTVVREFGRPERRSDDELGYLLISVNIPGADGKFAQVLSGDLRLRDADKKELPFLGICLKEHSATDVEVGQSSKFLVRNPTKWIFYVENPNKLKAPLFLEYKGEISKVSAVKK